MSDPHSHPADPDPAPEILTETEATQSVRGTGLFRVLAISLALVVVVLFGLYALNARRLSTNGGAGGQSGVTSHAQSDSFNAPEPAPKPDPANGTANSANTPTPH